MYKVFIDNTALNILSQAPESAENCVVIHAAQPKQIREAIFAYTAKVKNFDPIFLITPEPEKTFATLFENFDFIEAAGGIVKSKSKYLFIRRNGKWDIPKGKLEKGESSVIGAKREVEEECGISGVMVESLIGITYHTYKLKNRPTIKRTYWYAMNYEGNEALIPQTEEGITKVKWLKAEKLYKVEEDTYGSIIEVMKQYFQNH